MAVQRKIPTRGDKERAQDASIYNERQREAEERRRGQVAVPTSLNGMGGMTEAEQIAALREKLNETLSYLARIRG